MLNGQIIPSGGDVVITDVGEGAGALMCMTDRTDCCTFNESSHRRGEWIFPDGSLVGVSDGGGDIYRNRRNQLVLLHRRNNALEPLGIYCCEVDTRANPNGEMICINMGKQMTC